MTRTPALISDDLRARVLGPFSRAQLVELAPRSRWENHRGRLNPALGLQPARFSDGAVCAIPER